MIGELDKQSVRSCKPNHLKRRAATPVLDTRNGDHCFTGRNRHMREADHRHNHSRPVDPLE
jgi:hypothetical protein